MPGVVCYWCVDPGFASLNPGYDLCVDPGFASLNPGYELIPELR